MKSLQLIAAALLTVGLVQPLVQTPSVAMPVPNLNTVFEPSAETVAMRARAVVRPGVGVAGRPVARPIRPATPVRPARVVRTPHSTVVVVRPWVRKPYFGRVIGGVVIGSIIVVGVAGVAPAASASDLCWYWTDQTRTRGYWDYCR